MEDLVVEGVRKGRRLDIKVFVSGIKFINIKQYKMNTDTNSIIENHLTNLFTSTQQHGIAENSIA